MRLISCGPEILGDLTAYNLLLIAVPMFRKTLTILSLLGLLLSVGLWGASYFSIVVVPGTSGPAYWLMQGCIDVSWSEAPPENPLPSDYETLPVGTVVMTGARITMPATIPPRITGAQTVTYKTGWDCFGFDELATRWRPRFDRSTLPTMARLVVPFWIPVAVLASSLTLCCLPAYRRRKRRKLGLCLKCGYDLRGSGERCPECGTACEFDRPRLQGGE